MPVSWPSAHSGVSPYRPTAYTSLRVVWVSLNFVLALTLPASAPSPEQYAHGQARRNGSHPYSVTFPSSHVARNSRSGATISQFVGRWYTSATAPIIRPQWGRWTTAG